ncbi:hypothetical protein [uncultured Corynebacterium sp.]|uniref:LexA family protein n=1 Tax=uncultured Corynebacterium sp. TaxID=159447 RepID=UPI00341998E6
MKGQTTRAQFQAILGQSILEPGRTPTRKEIAAEVGCTPRTVITHLAALRRNEMLPEA